MTLYELKRLIEQFEVGYPNMMSRPVVLKGRTWNKDKLISTTSFELASMKVAKDLHATYLNGDREQ